MTRSFESGIDAVSRAPARTSSAWRPALGARVVLLEATREICQANSWSFRLGGEDLWHNRCANVGRERNFALPIAGPRQGVGRGRAANHGVAQALCRPRERELCPDRVRAREQPRRAHLARQGLLHEALHAQPVRPARLVDQQRRARCTEGVARTRMAGLTEIRT